MQKKTLKFLHNFFFISHVPTSLLKTLKLLENFFKTFLFHM